MDRTTDPLDLLLSASAPAVTADTDELRAELAALTDRTRAARRAPVRRRRLAATGGAAVLAVAGVSAAAATGNDPWGWWAERNPAAVYVYERPSGATCESRVGAIRADDPEASRAARAYVGSHDLAGDADVAAALAEIRAAGLTYPNADEEHDAAMHRAVGTLITDDLERRGFAVDTLGFSWGEETVCDGPAQ